MAWTFFLLLLSKLSNKTRRKHRGGSSRQPFSRKSRSAYADEDIKYNLPPLPEDKTLYDKKPFQYTGTRKAPLPKLSPILRKSLRDLMYQNNKTKNRRQIVPKNNVPVNYNYSVKDVKKELRNFFQKNNYTRNRNDLVNYNNLIEKNNRKKFKF